MTVTSSSASTLSAGMALPHRMGARFFLIVVCRRLVADLHDHVRVARAFDLLKRLVSVAMRFTARTTQMRSSFGAGWNLSASPMKNCGFSSALYHHFTATSSSPRSLSGGFRA